MGEAIASCEACVDLGIVGTDFADYVHYSASAQSHDRLAHEHLRERIRTLNAIEAERNRADAELARLRPEMERLRVALAEETRFDHDCNEHEIFYSERGVRATDDDWLGYPCPGDVVLGVERPDPDNLRATRRYEEARRAIFGPEEERKK